MRTFSLVFLLLSLTFCQKTKQDAEISIAFPTDPPSLDPLFATDLVSGKLSKFLYAGLFRIQDSRPIENLASSSVWKKEKDGIVWEIRLRKTQNGPSAEDVLFSLNRLLQGNSPRKGDYHFLKKISLSSEPNSIILSLDENTSEEEAKEKLALPFASILSKKKFTETGEFHSFGAYRVDFWKKNEFIDLSLKEPNPSLPGTIRIRILPQSSTSLFLYRKGELDAFKLTDFLLSLPEAKQENTLVKKGRSIQYVAINQTNPCFDKNFRYAINYSINRQEIISKLLEDKADLSFGPVPLPFFETAFPKTKVPAASYPYDPKKAMEYLKQSKCYPKILDTTLEFRMRGDDENQTKGRAILQALKNIGLKANLKGMEKAPLYKENGEGKGDLTLLTWYADYESVWNFLDPLFHSEKKGNGGNRSFYENEEVLKILKDRSRRDETTAWKVLEKVEKDAPWIFLWSIQENYMISEKFIRYESLSDYL
ncbi:ABC transporter substrate-binding protein [Leptospira idonii]|uniref:ABC transporter substrate-binding protein n=1 Tax=Leptospira idonii TaxID=1193500 RepID=A0A4R9M838_9LEPT|nr:ABC transporter substrate-binding protein [Leptospira idonii]TGN20728.1 ABC transporter substrate-binding protein [Leptospira idonii]